MAIVFSLSFMKNAVTWLPLCQSQSGHFLSGFMDECAHTHTLYSTELDLIQGTCLMPAVARTKFSK